VTRKPLLLIGDELFAEIACEYFNNDSDYQVVAFTVERPYLKRERLFDLPVVPFEDVEALYPPADHHFYAAAGYGQLNRLRTRLYRMAKAKGYAPASYVSSRAFVWRNVVLGEHCFIFENNVVQPFVRLGDNVVLWSGNHIGHHTRIGNHCFISSHVVISGGVDVGESCFFGVNSTLANDLRIGRDCLIGAGALLTKDLPENKVVLGPKGEVHARLEARAYFKVADQQAPPLPAEEGAHGTHALAAAGP
jgi:sugar O-acyltransferase (sialic acid O-acetyltransferase NeuD family)